MKYEMEMNEIYLYSPDVDREAASDQLERIDRSIDCLALDLVSLRAFGSLDKRRLLGYLDYLSRKLRIAVNEGVKD